MNIQRRNNVRSKKAGDRTLGAGRRDWYGPRFSQGRVNAQFSARSRARKPVSRAGGTSSLGRYGLDSQSEPGSGQVGRTPGRADTTDSGIDYAGGAAAGRAHVSKEL